MIFDFVPFDTSEQLIEKNRAAVEVSTPLSPPGNRRAVRIDQGEFMDARRQMAEYHDIARVHAFVAAGSRPA